MKNKQVKFINLGMVVYQEAWDFQEQCFKSIVDTKIKNRNENRSDQTSNFLIFCEHPHVYTLGKSGKQDNLLLNDEQLLEKKAEFYKINRGGDITYHGPGQLVGYPIIDLDNFFTDIHKYLRFLEESIILTCAEYSLEAHRIEGLTGVWIDLTNPRKICALGVKASRWVTMHGFAFNINTDLNYFNNIIPCGIDDKAVTSLSVELNKVVDFEEVSLKLKRNLANLFEMKFV